MIHHLSIPATDTRHVADVLGDLLGGAVTGFGPYPDSWIAWAGDEAGAAIANGAALDTSTLGAHTITVLATDNQGLVATKTAIYTVSA